MPYWSVTPSSKKNIGSNGHWVAFQRDGLYTVAEGEGRAYLKYNIRTFWISKSVRFEEMFVNLWFFYGVWTLDLYFFHSHKVNKKTLLCMFLHYEQEIDILNLNRCPYLLFLMREKFYPMTRRCCFFVYRKAEGFESKNIFEL
jgi:hypothetical protein